MSKEYHSERLLLRPAKQSDAEMYLELMNTPKWIDYIGDRKVKSIAEAEEYIQVKMIDPSKESGFYNYTVIRKEDKQKLGSCGIYDRPNMDGVDLGFAFLPQYRRNGYAYEAASCLLKVAKVEWGLRLCGAITIERNLESRALLKKLGFEFQKMINLANDPEDLMYLELEL